MSGGAPGVLEKALAMLELFTEQRVEWTATEVSRELTVPFSTAQRILRSLEQASLLERTEARSYRLGSGAIDLGRRARASFNLSGALTPTLQQLWRETDETAILTILDSRRVGVRCIERIEGGYPFKLSPELDTTGPLHAGASAKALLACLDNKTFDHIASVPLQRYAVNTIINPERLRKDLIQIRDRGWSFDDQELIDGAWSIAAPIVDDSGALIACIGFIAPTIRLTPALKRRGVRLVLEASEVAHAALRGRTAIEGTA